MGALANTLFQALLGWVRTVGSVIWNGVTRPDSQSLAEWIGKNWLPTAAALCLVGLITDFIVYLFRWQPYRVWGRFFRRLFRRETETEYDTDGNGNAGEENFATVRQSATGDAGPENRYFIREETEADSPRNGWSYSAVSEEPEESDEEYTARIEQAIKPRRRRRTVREMLSEEPSAQPYAAPQDLIDRREAYRRPVYPQNRKGNEDIQS